MSTKLGRLLIIASLIASIGLVRFRLATIALATTC
jgi:hypothetical protein